MFLATLIGRVFPATLSTILGVCSAPMQDDACPRARDAGITVGRLATGSHNAITDVPGVRVGHATLIRGDDVRTGVTVVLPHGGNVFQHKVPAAIVAMNGYGKLAGATQVAELGELESPIALTNTLSVGKVVDALVGHVLALAGNEDVRSVNVVVGETNDGGLNDIRARHVGAEHVEQALRDAREGPVEEGAVGAGTGTRCFGLKGGIGTASRSVAAGDARYTIGVLVQSNFGGALRIDGHAVPAAVLDAGLDAGGDDGAPRGGERRDRREEPEHGSCMIVIATDAPLDARKLERLARRAFAGMARTGATFSNGSGDYAIAFSTAPELRVPARAHERTPHDPPAADPALQGGRVLRNDRLTPLFVAVAEATEEAILNSLFRARTVTSKLGTARALPVERVAAWWKRVQAAAATEDGR